MRVSELLQNYDKMKSRYAHECCVAPCACVVGMHCLLACLPACVCVCIVLCCASVTLHAFACARMCMFAYVKASALEWVMD